MRIVVLVKPVPDTASGGERLRPDDWRLDRAATPAVVNANDEYALEAALKLTEAHGGEVTSCRWPAQRARDDAQGAGDGRRERARSSPTPRSPAPTRSPRRGSSPPRSADLEYDLLLAGADTSDGGAGVVPAGVATLLGLPYLSYAAKIEPTRQPARSASTGSAPTGFDVLEAPMPALVVATQALGEPRYPSLKGIMAARSKSIETKALADVEDVGGAAAAPDGVGGAVATTAVLGAEAPPPRAATRVIREPADEAARAGRRVPRRAEDHLMAGAIWVHGEAAPDGSLAKISTRSRRSRAAWPRPPARTSSAS